MRRAYFGAVIGENRLLRSYDVLNHSIWGWTSVLGPDVQGIREVINTFGENVVALCDLIGGGQAIYHSPDGGESWSKVLQATEIYDITSVGINWTLASTSDGWYTSLTSGSTWELVSDAGAPIGRSVVWVTPNHLFTHTGDAIHLSEYRAESWDQICNLEAITGYIPSTTHSIDGYQGRIMATCGRTIVKSDDLGGSWEALNAATTFRDWKFVKLPVFRQIAFWDTLDAKDPSKSRWMVSVLISSNLIRTYVNRATPSWQFSPVLDMAASERHRILAEASMRWGSPVIEHYLVVSGDRSVNKELKHAMAISTDGVTFTDVLGGGTGNIIIPSCPTLDKAMADLVKLEDTPA